ncbi:MAG: SEC-C domain-containing protein [Thermoanaerobaculales bacterium]|nr:SEC-C domain-containing protein [Thermoanaerobaculales bacterium]
MFKREAPPDTARNMGRNELCWCGSGSKYKSCHCDRDRLHFAQLRAEGCRGGS